MTVSEGNRRVGRVDDGAAIPETVAVKKHPGWWVAAALVVACLVLVGLSLARNPRVSWGTVGHYLFDPYILEGLRRTAVLAILATVLAVIIGLVFGFVRLSRNPVLRAVGAAYVWVFRSVPTLIQVLFWGNMALFVPTISLTVPGSDSRLFSVPMNDVLTPWLASVAALAVANGAYFAEIVRAGVLSVNENYHLAASALGLNWVQRQRKIVIPISLRVMLPPGGNQFITILKETTLVSVIGGAEILNHAQTIYGNNFRVVELLMVAAIWFLAVTSIAYLLQSWLERRVGRGQTAVRTAPRWRDWRAALGRGVTDPPEEGS